MKTIMKNKIQHLIPLLFTLTVAAQTPTWIGDTTTNYNYTNKLWGSAANRNYSNSPKLTVEFFTTMGAWCGGKGDVWNETNSVTLAWASSPNATNWTTTPKFYLTYTQNGTNWSFGATNWIFTEQDRYLIPLYSTNSMAGNVTGFVVRPTARSYPRN